MSRAVCPPRTPTRWSRRLVALSVVVALVTALGIGAGTVVADAQRPVGSAGHHVVEPGQTLLEIAGTTAPEDIGTRRQLQALREVNGLGAEPVATWQVLVLPAW